MRKAAHFWKELRSHCRGTKKTSVEEKSNRGRRQRSLVEGPTVKVMGMPKCRLKILRERKESMSGSFLSEEGRRGGTRSASALL